MVTFHNQVTWELQKIFGLDPWMFWHPFFFWGFPGSFFFLESPKRFQDVPWYHMIFWWNWWWEFTTSCTGVASGKKSQWNQWWSHQECFLRTCKSWPKRVKCSPGWWRMMTWRWPALPSVFPPCERTQNPSPWRRRRGGTTGIQMLKSKAWTHMT